MHFSQLSINYDQHLVKGWYSCSLLIFVNNGSIIFITVMYEYIQCESKK